MSEENITVTRNDERGSYEIRVDDEPAGFTRIQPDEQGRLVMAHTSIDPDFAGRGLGSILVGRALADIAARGETIVPVCPFIVRFLASHTVDGLRVDDPDSAEASAG